MQNRLIATSVLAFSASLASASFVSNVNAQTLYYEPFNNNAPDWRTTASGGLCSNAAFETTRSLVLTTENTRAMCAGTYEHETLPGCGGRVFAGPPSGVVDLTPGQPYCITGWMRITAGGNTESGYIGLKGTNGAGVLNGSEQWLIGGNVGAQVHPSLADIGSWHWYAAAFTPGAPFTHVVLMNERFSGGAAVPVDFDDLKIISGACPVAPAADEASHRACAGNTPACSATTSQCVACNNAVTELACDVATPVCTAAGACATCTADNGGGGNECGAANPLCAANGTCTKCAGNSDCTAGGVVHAGAVCELGSGKCVQCTANNDCGGNTPVCSGNVCVACNNAAPATSCAAATPVCTVAGACATCTVDNGQAGNACGSTKPFCNADGTCGKCTDNSAGATGCTSTTPAHAGPICNATSGACGTSCAKDVDCNNGWCSAASCSGKLANGTPIPGTAQTPVAGRDQADPAFNGMCTVAVGVAACTSGLCSTTNNLCGAAGGENCAGDASCQSGKCGADNKCLECVTDSHCGSTTSGRVCNINGSCQNGCRATGGNGCPSTQICSSTNSTIGACSNPQGDAGISDGGVNTDGGLKTDAGKTNDAGTVVTTDSGVTNGNAAGNDSDLEGGGVSCASSGTSGGGFASLSVGALVALSAIARRKRR